MKVKPCLKNSLLLPVWTIALLIVSGCSKGLENIDPLSKLPHLPEVTSNMVNQNMVTIVFGITVAEQLQPV